MKQNFFDEIDDWGDLISDVYNDNFIFKPEYEYVLNNGKNIKIINHEYTNNEIEFNKKLKLDNDLNEICRNAFFNCSNLTDELIIPDSVEKIGTCSFFTCPNFTSLKLSNNLKEIKYKTFYNCTGFTGELIIPDSVIKIYQCAFLNCYGFTSLKLSNNLKEIRYEAFLKCSGMQGELIIPESVESIGYGAFMGCAFDKIYVPKNYINKYDENWNKGCNAEIIEY